MILGVYWYFGFPEGLYKFDYFKFERGYGGHADNPAVLMTQVRVLDSDTIIEKLRLLIEKYPEGFLFVYKDGNKLKLGTGSHQLYDYDFLFIKEVDKFLSKENVVVDNNQKLSNPQLIRIEKNEGRSGFYPKKNFLQIVSSSPRKYNAETLSLRMDCNVLVKVKKNFLSEVKMVLESLGVDVFFYKDYDYLDKSNLMIFFTNGRQGLNLQPKKFIDILKLEELVEPIMQKYEVKLGHEGGYDFYPKDGPKVEKIIDREFIIG